MSSSALAHETSRVAVRTAESEPAPATAERPAGVARNVTALASGQLVTWTVTLLWTLVVPRFLGPAGLGMVVSAMSVSGVLGIVLGLGTRNYLVREIVIDRPAAPRLVGTAIVLRVVMAPLVALSAVVYARLAHYNDEASVVLYLVAAYTVMTLLYEPMLAGFQAVERMKYLAYSDVVNKTGQSVFGITLVILGLGATGIAADMAAMAGVVIVLNAFWLRQFFPIELRTSPRALVQMVRESLAYCAYGLFGMVYLWMDAIMLSLMTRSEVVGWYGAPTRIFQTLMFIPVLLSTAWLPRLVAAFKEGHDRLLMTARTPIELVLVISAPVAAGTAMIAGPLIHTFYGAAYGPAVGVMVLLAICMVPMYLNIILSQVLLAAKRQVVWTWVMAAAAVVNPLFNLVLIPATESRYGNGAIGAAMSMLLTELLMLVVGFVLVGRHVFDRRSGRRGLLAIAASAAMWAAARAAQPFVGTLPSFLVGGCTFLVLAAAFRIATAEELEFLRRGFERLRLARRAQ